MAGLFEKAGECLAIVERASRQCRSSGARRRSRGTTDLNCESSRSLRSSHCLSVS